MRYERKFVPDGLSFEEVLALVRAHPAAFREVYPERWVHNVYLDTVDRRAYFEHVHGVPERTKTRVRWYSGPAANGSPPVLELKHRHGLLGSKESFRLVATPKATLARDSSLVGHLRAAGLPAGTQLRLDGLEPALRNAYRRRYFESGDRRFRLTVDSDLEFALPGWSTMRPAHDALPRVVLELKYDASLAPSAPSVTGVFPFRVQRCSKYVLGVDLLTA